MSSSHTIHYTFLYTSHHHHPFQCDIQCARLPEQQCSVSIECVGNPLCGSIGCYTITVIMTASLADTFTHSLTGQYLHSVILVVIVCDIVNVLCDTLMTTTTFCSHGVCLICVSHHLTRSYNHVYDVRSNSVTEEKRSLSMSHNSQTTPGPVTIGSLGVINPRFDAFFSASMSII